MSQTEVQLIKADAVQTADIANSAVTDAKISALTSSKLTGALPAISGAALTGIASAGKATNLVINGAMLVAQRGTSATTNGYATVDRFETDRSGLDEGPTFAQVDVASGTTPYTLGFRKAFKITNGNQTGGAGSSDRLLLSTKLEAQDIASSGWNYLSASSNITLSFWVKSSVAQNFYFRIQATDGTVYSYVMETGSLSANTWTKITKTIPGNSNLTFNNDNGEGLLIRWALFRGTDNTGTRPLNAWAAYDGSTRYPDVTSTWYTTNDATFEITGVQLEVGDSATDFEHLSYADNLLKCQRYFYMLADHAAHGTSAFGRGETLDTASCGFQVYFPCNMRSAPTIHSVNTGSPGFLFYKYNTYYHITGGWYIHAGCPTGGQIYTGVQGSPGENVPGRMQTNASAAQLGFIAEL